MKKKIRIGTRGSELALWQAKHVAGLIGIDKTELVIIKTEGDRIQNVSFVKMEGKGFFTKEIEEALLQNRIDLAVHSLKDLPTEDVKGLKVAAVPERADSRDMLIMHDDVYKERGKLHVREGALIGTSSMRRMAQLRSLDNSIRVEALRGNVNTRLRKLKDRDYDAIVMAKAGVERIGLDISAFRTQVLEPEIFLPAPAQGALGIQVREDDSFTLSVVRELTDTLTETTVRAERSFLRAFGGGCHVPLGALASIENGIITLRGIVASPDGTFTASGTVTGSDPETVGMQLAKIIKAKGADKYI
ncbi:MAG TPA: hydroxymethylbilane synthase [Spirochaetota bacterium]|nr:hydroxymethylbilane synthase [Spirochaetota bacterium]